MLCFYRNTKQGVRLLRVFSPDTLAELPEKIGQEPVTELAPYLFSDQFEPERGEETGSLYDTLTGRCEETAWEELRGRQDALCGERLQGAVLPKCLAKIGRYAFYNCFGLKELSFGAALKDIGAGAFTGCHHVERLFVETGADGTSCLREILAELPEKIRVTYRKGPETGVFWFPEFFEEGVENTPARILENHVHGSGVRYRNCFSSRALNIREYDSLFAYAKAWESPETVADLVLDRLQYPLGLSEEAKKRYQAYLQEMSEEICGYLIRQKDGDRLLFALGQSACGAEVLDRLLDIASKTGFTEGVACLMEERHRRFRPKKRSFSL
ncbi:MAG: leucine-rich repeat protein [Eubacteriales bacterium]|nr:leucine-rich repeat protein [Eubacteriales bacterium]